MGKLAEEFKREEVESFKRRFNIPDNVIIRLAGESEHEVGVFPLVAITEGGLRFPVSSFLRKIFLKINLSPKNVSHNFYRIVNGVDAINNRYRFHLSEWDLLYYYSIQKIRRGENKWYLKSCPEKALVHLLPDTIKGIEDDLIVVSGHWMHGPEEDPFPPITARSLGPDNQAKKAWARGRNADQDHIDKVLKFLGGPDSYPFARSAPVLLDYILAYHSFISSPQSFAIGEATKLIHKWFSWSEAQKWDFFQLRHPDWIPPPVSAIPFDSRVITTVIAHPS